MENSKFVANFDMLAMDKKAFNAFKKFFESYDGIEFGDGGACGNINVDCVELRCDNSNKHAKKLIGGFLIIFEQEEHNTGWEWLEELAPGISEIKNEWDCKEVWDFWNAFCDLSDKIENGEIDNEDVEKMKNSDQEMLKCLIDKYGKSGVEAAIRKI